MLIFFHHTVLLFNHYFWFLLIFVCFPSIFVDFFASSDPSILFSFEYLLLLFLSRFLLGSFLHLCCFHFLSNFHSLSLLSLFNILFRPPLFPCYILSSSFPPLHLPFPSFLHFLPFFLWSFFILPLFFSAYKRSTRIGSTCGHNHFVAMVLFFVFSPDSIGAATWQAKKNDGNLGILKLMSSFATQTMFTM